MNSKKFEGLRKKLDAIGCTQTLHPDSFELVQQLYNNLYKHMTEVHDLRTKMKEMNNTNSNSIDAEEHINNLIQEKETLKKKLEEAKSRGGSRENDQRLHNLNMLVNNFKIKQEESTLEYEREVKKLSSQIASLELRNSQLEKQNTQLRSTVSLNSNESERYSAQLTSLVEKKSREIRQLEDSNSKLRIKIQVLERTIEDNKFATKDNKDDSKAQSDRLQQILKQELADSEMRVRQLKTQLETTRDEVDDVRRELRRSREEILLLKKQENSARSIETIDRVGKQKMEVMYSQAKQQLSEKIDQLKFAKDRFEQEERERSRLQLKVKELFNKNKFLTEKNSDLQTQIQHISSKSTLNIKKVRELEAVNVSLEKQLKEYQENSFSETKDKNQYQLREQQSKIEQLRKQAVIKERQLKLFEQELKVLKEQGEQRAIERDKAQTQLRKFQNIVAEGSRNLQALQLQKEQLMKQNRQLRSGKQMLSSADSSSKSEIFLLRQKLQARQGELDQFKAILHSEQIINKELETEIMKLKTVVANSEQKNREIFEDNKMMAGQIKALEQRKIQLHEKVKNLQQRCHLQVEGSSQTKREFEQLRQRNEQLLRIIAKKDQSILIIDQEKDKIQDELDRQTEEREKLRQYKIRKEREIDQYSKNIEQRQQMINDLSRKLSRSQDERQNMDRQNERLVQNNVMLQDRNNALERELRQMQNQVNLLVCSSKQSERQADRSKNKVAELDRKLKDMIRQYEEEKQRASAMTILNNEFQVTLENQRAETIRLKGFLRQLEDANNQMYQHLSKKDKQLDEYGRHIEQSERRQEQLLHQINSYQHELEHLTQDFESLQDDARRLSGQKQFFKSERNWKKQVSSLTEDCRSKQEKRYLDLQDDYHKCKKINEELKQKIRHLQNLLSEQRTQNFRLSQNLGLPTRTVLVESRVESYHQGENFNNSNIYHRSRNQSVPSVSDNLSVDSRESQSIQAKESLEEIERRYMQTSLPNGRP